MQTTWLGADPDDMIWLAEVHGVPPDMKCAILFGNEDAPARIEAWREYNPHYQTAPDFVWPNAN